MLKRKNSFSYSKPTNKQDFYFWKVIAIEVCLKEKHFNGIFSILNLASLKIISFDTHRPNIRHS